MAKKEVPESTGYHEPVMLKEVVEGLKIHPDGTYVDCTFGGGGHSKAILEKLSERGRLIAFDQDTDASQNIPPDRRILFIPHNFKHLGRFLKLHKIGQVNGILADLGVSSYQIDTPARGFSTRWEGELDMRMDRRQSLTAREVIRSYSEQQLHKLFERYGEVTNAKTLARTIVQSRSEAPITTVNQFKAVIQKVIRGNPAKYLAQVFQALRIEVNDEIGSLTEFLMQIPSVLKGGGRIAVITFHSIEDRLVKNFFRKGTFEEDVFDVMGHKETVFRIITKKPIVASERELKTNPRSRSAKLRVAEKINGE